MAGRPKFEPTDDQRDAVEVAAGARRTLKEISDFVGIDEATLNKHFKRELTVGANRRRCSMVLAMYKAGLNGAVSAQREYLGLGDEPEPPPVKPRKREAVSKQPLGKKERVRRDAFRAGTDSEWGNDLKPPAGSRPN